MGYDKDGYEGAGYGSGVDFGAESRTEKSYVKFVPVGYPDTHSMAVGYLFWIIGFTGAHRFYYGRKLTGILWFFTGGLFGVGWLIDLFLIPGMDNDADRRYAPGNSDYALAWILLIFLGMFGLHRFYQGRLFTGLVFLLTGGLFGIGYVFDVLSLNEQISERHQHQQVEFSSMQYGWS